MLISGNEYGHRERMWKKPIPLVVLLLLACMVNAQGRAYDFSLKDTDSRSVSFSEISGKYLTVIDFWATWCQPCIRSLPKLVELSERYRAQGVGFIGVSVDSPRNLSKVKPFARSMGITYPVLLDPNGELMGELNVTAVPTLLIIDSRYRILYMHEGFNAGDELTIREEIEKYLTAKEH
jgi:cytochrome c biogenesis protein CcmG/thiol:disulfide interchange protein DsbE